MSIEMERRYVPLTAAEIRAEGEGETMIIEGRPIVYNRETVLYSDDEYELREIILPGATTAALEAREEVLLWNHASDKPMARRKNGSLEVIEDGNGVRIRADVSKTKWGRDGYEAIRNDVVDAMSFGFFLNADGYKWEREKKDGKTVDRRTISAFSRIVDYSPVTYPAYKDTEVQARSKDLALKTRPEMSGEGPDGGDERESEAVREAIQVTLDEIEERKKTWKN